MIDRDRVLARTSTKGKKMLDFNKIKTIQTATKTVIKAIKEGETLRLDYAKQVIALTVAKHDSKNLKALDTAVTAFTADETARTPKGEKQSRIHKDLKSLLNNCKKYSDRLYSIDSDGMTFNQLLTAVASLKEPKTAKLTKTAVETKTAKEEPKTAITKTAVETPKVDVKEIIENSKDDIINHSKELAKQSKEELISNVEALLNQVEELDTSKMTVERLATVQALLTKVLA